uniref:Uncharacterized protein n=1 Tax=Meloidogyne incognita TaxID=6306 RepID=A0A914N9V2_MELIC
MKKDMYYFILIIYFQFLVNYLIISKVDGVGDEKGKRVAESSKALKGKNMPPSYFIIEKMDRVVENLDKVSKVEEKSLKTRGETSNENDEDKLKNEVSGETSNENESEIKVEEEDKLKKEKEKNELIEKEREHLIKLSEVVKNRYIIKEMAKINELSSMIYEFLFNNNLDEGLSSIKLGNILKEINETLKRYMEFEGKLGNDEEITLINNKEKIFVIELINTVFSLQYFFGNLKLEIVLGQKLIEFSNEKLNEKIKIEEERINNFLKNFMIDKNEYLMIKYGKKKKNKFEDKKA